MRGESSKSYSASKKILSFRLLYDLLGPHAYSVIIFGALFCTLAVKFFHSYRTGLLNEYMGWILADIAVLLAIEVVLTLVCFRWPQSWVIRIACVVAAGVCAWSIINAGWVIRGGMQILPTVFVPFVLNPLTTLITVVALLIDMPASGFILLIPTALAVAFFFFVLRKPTPPNYNRKLFAYRILICVIFILTAVLAYSAVAKQGSASITSAELRYNCHLKAVKNLLFADTWKLTKEDLANAERTIPAFDEVGILLKQERINHNVVLIVLEGVQYMQTSLGDRQSNLTPYLENLASQGAEFTNFRSTLTHTTKALFSLLTGRYPSTSQDITEAVPSSKPYASIPTILKDQLNYRTAFFQSAKGNFESRPGLVYNLGFDKYLAREDLADPEAFLGYLACDEFSMLKPIVEWIKASENPFFLTVLCSATHDPYEVPQWYGVPARKLIERYRQAISYTDKFIAALDNKLTELNLVDETIFCVVGDHGEAFGEHGMFGHIRIAYDELLHIPCVVRAPSLIEPDTKITEAVSSVDLAPTIFSLFGFDTDTADFDGINMLKAEMVDRKVYFSGWLQESPAGFVRANRKFIYDPTNNMVSVFDLKTDPFELNRIELPEAQAQRVAAEIIAWRKKSIFRIDQMPSGSQILFDSWLCRWSNRFSWAKYNPERVQ